MSALASGGVAIVTSRLPQGFAPERPLAGMVGPLEAAARSLAAAGCAVEILTLAPAEGDAPAPTGKIRRRDFNGDEGALMQALSAGLAEGRLQHLLAGPASDAVAVKALALVPERACLWCGLTAPPQSDDSALASALFAPRALLYGGEVEKRAIVAAFGAGLGRAKLEAPALYGMAPRRYSVAPTRRPGAHPYLAHLGPLSDGPLREWFPKLRDAMAFTAGPLDLYLLGGETTVGTVGMRALGPLEPAGRFDLVRDAVAALDLGEGQDVGLQAGLRMVDAWRLGAPAILSASNWPAVAELAAGGGVAAADFDGLRDAVSRLRDPETRAAEALVGRERAARIGDPDRFQRALLALMEI